MEIKRLLLVLLLVGSLASVTGLASATHTHRMLLQDSDTTPAPDSDDPKGMGQGIANLLDKITSPTQAPTAGPAIRAPHKPMMQGIQEFVQSFIEEDDETSVPGPAPARESEAVTGEAVGGRRVQRAMAKAEKAQAQADEAQVQAEKAQAQAERAQAHAERVGNRVSASAVATPRLGGLSGETLGATVAGTGLVAALLGAAVLTYRRRNQKLQSQGQSRRLLVSVGAGYATYGALDTEERVEDLEATPLLHDDHTA